jgi:Holliday junction resolvase RusA-like endonuclease
VLRPDAPIWVTSKPDIDKLERALLDGMTAVVYVDDDQVVAVRKAKRYEMPDEPPGVRVWVTELAER